MKKHQYKMKKSKIKKKKHLFKMKKLQQKIKRKFPLQNEEEVKPEEELKKKTLEKVNKQFNKITTETEPENIDFIIIDDDYNIDNKK